MFPMLLSPTSPGVWAAPFGVETPIQPTFYPISSRNYHRRLLYSVIHDSNCMALRAFDSLGLSLTWLISFHRHAGSSELQLMALRIYDVKKTMGTKVDTGISNVDSRRDQLTRYMERYISINFSTEIFPSSRTLWDNDRLI
ncbi:hypothetical protein PTI98_009788 [Pleurotus ostreatus]|nr:hypothetical protein PTI98_009788 [Pleurotus ostreatus]